MEYSAEQLNSLLVDVIVIYQNERWISRALYNLVWLGVCTFLWYVNICFIFLVCCPGLLSWFVVLVYFPGLFSRFNFLVCFTGLFSWFSFLVSFLGLFSWFSFLVCFSWFVFLVCFPGLFPWFVSLVCFTDLCIIWRYITNNTLSFSCANYVIVLRLNKVGIKSWSFRWYFSPYFASISITMFSLI